MENRFHLFLSNNEKKLRDLLQQDVSKFSQSLATFYPNANKFFTDDTEEFAKKAIKFVVECKKSALALMSKYESYDVESDKVVLTKKDGEVETLPIVPIKLIIETGLKMKPEDEGYFLIASFLIQPLNYDAVQLFGAYLDKS